MATTMKRSRHPSSSEDSDNGRRKPKKMNVKTQRKIKKGKNERKAQKGKPPASLKKRRTVKDIPTGRKTKKSKSKPVKTKRKIKNEKKERKERKERKVKPPVSLVIKRQSRDRRKSWTIKDIPTGNSTCWSQQSQLRRGSGQKPSEVFRTDLITAMKVPDSFQLCAEDFCVLADPWRQEWEKGVQVPVSPQSIPQPVARVLLEKGKEVMFSRPKKLIRTSGCEALGYVDIRTLAEGMCRYDLSQEDVCWLHMANQEFTEMALPPLDEITMERTMEEFERCCHDSMSHAMATEEGLGIEYDEDVVCDVCQSPDGEDNNEMVFCDKCNICVHQACYGIQKVPKGSWLCRICALGITPKCQLCPKKGGAMKPTRSGTKWVHVSCALWIPEVSIGNPEKMEPITNVSQIPSNRWALICCVCKEKTGACIQCSANNCRTAFHVTCGLSASLEMNTLLTDEDEVKFKSFCPKHSGLEGEGEGEGGEDEREREREGTAIKKGKRRGRKFCLLSLTNEEEAATSSSSSIATGDIISRQQEKRVNLRKLKVQAIEEDFYRFVEVDDVAGRLKLPRETVDFLYQYWKLKRKANHSQPLLTPKRDEEESLARREQEVLLRRLQLFTHLRQDLERVRNLTYMVTRREKMKRSLWKVQEQVFQHQVKLIDQELINGDPSAKDLEQLFSLGWLSSQSSQSALKPKRPLKPEKKKNTDRKTFSDSPHTHTQPPPHTHTQTHTHKHYSVCKPSDSKDSKSTRIIIKEAASTQPTSEISETQREIFPKQEIATETVTVKLHRPEIRKGSSADRRKRNTTNNNHEQQDLRRRKKRIIDNMAESSVKNKLASKHLEKTVSIRLVDIRNSEADEYFFDHEGGISKRSHPVSLDVTAPNSKQQQQQHSDATVATTTKANGWLRKPHSNGSHTPNNNNTRHVTSSAGGHLKHLKGWGKFRIPKRSEKSPTNEDDGDGLLGPLSNTPEQPLSSYPRTRLRTTGTESDGYTSDSKSSKDGGEAEPCLKRCHSHKLRGDATAMGRRYGSDIIQRGVLAL